MRKRSEESEEKDNRQMRQEWRAAGRLRTAGGNADRTTAQEAAGRRRGPSCCLPGRHTFMCARKDVHSIWELSGSQKMLVE